MKSGGVVPEKYVRATVELLWDERVLTDFLAMQDIPDQGPLTVDQVIEFVAGPLVSRPVPAPGAEDWFMKGLEGLVRLFTGYAWGNLVRDGTLCRDENDVRIAVNMILTTAGHHIAGGRTDISDERAIQLAESYVRLTRDQYLTHVLDGWRAAPWSLAFAVVDRRRVGCSRVLPLTISAYGDIRAGHRSIHACAAADLVQPSRFLFIESVGERPEKDFALVGSRTAQQLRTIFLQMAMLSLCDDAAEAGPGMPLSILSIAGTPTDHKRARKFGFHPIGTRMAEFDKELMELDERRAWFLPLVVGYLQQRLVKMGLAASRA
jgi:hypothetical protein